MRTITYCDAINEAMVQEMERDSKIFTYGIDVADHKRIFNSTKGLVEKFGPDRCFSTPLSEDAMSGFGLGAAMNGLKPVHIHMRVDFFMLAMNQLANMISSNRYMSRGKFNTPFVIRLIIGRGWGQGSQHSKSMHSCYAHIPGVKVVMPSTPKDAKGLLIAAMRDNNPVVVIEHRWLYWTNGDVPAESYVTPIGKANILKEGKDVTVVATSWMNVEAVQAADILKKRGVSLEVIDPRTIAPLDEETIINSVKKTGHCIVADNDWVKYGFCSEVASRVYDKCYTSLKSPITKLGFAETPCPTARHLENEFYPNAINIIREVEKKLKLTPTDLSKEKFYSYENKFKGPF